MKRLFCFSPLFLSGALLLAQTPAPDASSASPHTYANDLGFSYSLPSDWEVVDVHSGLADVKQQASQTASSDAEKKGVACVQLPLSAHHGTPSSAVVEVALPFDCFGEQFSESDLPGFASGASEGMKETFDIKDSQHATYSLGTHHMWIERVTGTIKEQPGTPAYTIEVACGLLKKAAVCWMAMAADSAALQVFEKGEVTLDDDAPVALVPSTAFQKKPAS
jgi:hypothetical protein